jgi:hypothetical protein
LESRHRIPSSRRVLPPTKRPTSRAIPLRGLGHARQCGARIVQQDRSQQCAMGRRPTGPRGLPDHAPAYEASTGRRSGSALSSAPSSCVSAGRWTPRQVSQESRPGDRLAVRDTDHVEGRVLRVDHDGVLVDWGRRLKTQRHAWSDVGARFVRLPRRTSHDPYPDVGQADLGEPLHGGGRRPSSRDAGSGAEPRWHRRRPESHFSHRRGSPNSSAALRRRSWRSCSRCASARPRSASAQRPVSKTGIRAAPCRLNVEASCTKCQQPHEMQRPSPCVSARTAQFAPNTASTAPSGGGSCVARLRGRGMRRPCGAGGHAALRADSVRETGSVDDRFGADRVRTDDGIE